ncbi:transporter [Uliginosibacterium sediminicola]|uniref:Transporter n=1 Tax=Uliginosibacterium sediminicola TaxID=2024550 RepID=A0ABU9YXP1_9RHOO
MSLHDARYGTDQHGLICGFILHPDAPASELSSQRAAEWLQEGAAERGEGFLWLHFNLSHTGAEKWLANHAGLPHEFFENLRESTREGAHSTRIELIDNSLQAVINDVHYDFSFEASDISTLWLAVGPRCVVSARRRPLRSVDRLREAVRQGEIIRSPLALLIHLLRDQEEVLVGIVRRVTQRIDEVEDKLLAGKLSVTRGELGALRRLLVRLQRLLAPEPASLFRLLQVPPAWIDAADGMELRQSTEEFSVVLRDMSALQERIKLLQEELAAHVNEQNNQSLYVLTIVTVLALPINIVAGLLGMNVGGIPLAQHEDGFWIVVMLIASFTGLAAWWAFKKK